MAIQYVVQAEVVDITKDMPRHEDVFLVDTNVWYWMTYTRASQSTRPPAIYQTSCYPNYMNTALNTGSRIFQSGLSLAELTHLIEKAEFEIFAKANPAIFQNPVKFDKNFRHDCINERINVLSEIRSAWKQVSNLAEPLSVIIDTPTTMSALTRLQTEQVDGYDLFILESMKTHGVVQVITDDGDFATVPGIQVFTANRNAIKAATEQNKLVAR